MARSSPGLYRLIALTSLSATILVCAAIACTGRKSQPSLTTDTYRWIRQHPSGSCYATVPIVLTSAVDDVLAIDVTKNRLQVTPYVSLTRFLVSMSGSVAAQALQATGEAVLPVTSSCSVAISNRLDGTIVQDGIFDGQIAVHIDAAVLATDGLPSNCSAVTGTSVLGFDVPFPMLSNPTNGSCDLVEPGQGIACSITLGC